MITRSRFTSTPHWTYIVTFFGWVWLCLKPGKDGPPWHLVFSAHRLGMQGYHAMRNLLREVPPPSASKDKGEGKTL